MSQTSKKVTRWRHRTKKRLVEAFGGKCCICGFDSWIEAFEFHHLDPTIKQGKVIEIANNWSKIIEEARKCIMICSNCHKGVHGGHINIPDNAQRFNEDFAEYRVKKEDTDECPVCKGRKLIYQITCSKICGAKMRYNIDWELFDLLKMYKEYGTYTAVAKKVGCSDTTIRKRILKLKN